MKKRPSLPLLALVAVVALVLGSFGTAVAGPAVTRGAVKKIAKKVVTQAAPTLSVAHATTADSATSAANATTLNGKSAAAYLSTAFMATIPNKTVPGSSLTETLPTVTPGNYLTTINFSATLSAATDLSCLIRQNGTILMWSYGAVFNSDFAWINDSRVIAIGNGALTLFCLTGDLMTTPISSAPVNSISFQPLDAVTSLGTAAPRPAGGPPNASGAP